MAFSPDIDTVIGNIITKVEAMTDFTAGTVHKYGFSVASTDNVKSGSAWAVVDVEGGFGVRRVPFHISVFKLIADSTDGAEHTARAALQNLAEDIMEAIAPNNLPIESDSLFATMPEREDPEGARINRGGGLWRFDVTGVYVRNPIAQ